MASASKVGTTSTAAVTSAPSPVTAGGRFAQTQLVDGVSSGASAGIDGRWRPTYEDGTGGGGGFSQQQQRRGPEQEAFTPLIGRSAAAYPATEASVEPSAAPPVFLTDLMRGVSIYEFNMKVIAGGKAQGQVFSRYF